MFAPPEASSRHLWFAFAVVAAMALWRALVLAFDSPPLSFDEAQYWAWAQRLQFGYYSKPPMIAWAIAATTGLCGESEGCIKAGSLIAHTGTAVVLFFLGRLLFGHRVGAWAAVVWATLPAVSLSSLIITTDPFLLLFWAAALVCLIEAARRGAAANRWWLLLGVSLGLGLLAKYAMLLFAASVALWLVWEPAQRRVLRGAGLWLALALAALILAPNLLWNALNGFVTVAHTRDNANLGGELGNPVKLGEFLASQVAVVGPVVMAALVTALAGALAAPRRASAAVRLLAAFVLPVLTLMTVEAFLSRANANWSAPAYVAGTVLAVAVLVRWGRWALPLAVAVNLSAAVVLYNFDVLAPRLGVPSRIDPAKRLKGWPEVGARVSAHLAAHPGARLLADERKVLATLTYYVRPHPFDAVKWNPSGRIHDHFDQTTRLEPGAGPLIYVGEWREVAETIAPDFTAARHIEDIRIPLPAGDRVVTVWLFDGFKGY